MSNNILRHPWQQKYDKEYARKVDKVIRSLDHSRSISKIQSCREKYICPQMLTKKDFKILCKEISRALSYYSGMDKSIYDLMCNEPLEEEDED